MLKTCVNNESRLQSETIYEFMKSDTFTKFEAKSTSDLQILLDKMNAIARIDSDSLNSEVEDCG